MAGNKKSSQAKGKPPPAKGRQQPVRRPPVQAPRFQKRGVMAPVATNISNGRSGSKVVRLVERERVATLSGSAEFKIQRTLQINPAVQAFLPWLSTMAQLYEKYRVKSVRVMYHNLCGTNAAGNVLMSYDPDVLDSAPTDAVSFSQSTRYVDGAPWRMLTLNIPGSNQALFTRSGSAPATSDLKTYDYGQIHIATEAMTDDSSVGYVEIAYDFEFLERQPAPASGGNYSFRPQIYAGVPDPTVPLAVRHDTAYGQYPSQDLIYDGIVPLQTLVDDIGVSSFNGSLVLPPGSFALSTSMPTGGYAADSTRPSPTSVEPVAPDLATRLLTALGVKPITGKTPKVPPVFHDSLKFKWVDSSGATIDAVGIADLTGVSLLASFTLRLCDDYTSPPNYFPAYEVNGRPIQGSGSFTTVLSPQLPGEGIWPTAVITQLA